MAITPIIKSFLTISAGSRLIRFAISATVIPSVYSNSVGNSWNLRSVTGFGVWLRLFCLFLFYFSCCYSSYYFFDFTLILTTSILLLFSRTIFFVIIIVVLCLVDCFFLRCIHRLLSLQELLLLLAAFVQLT